MAYQGFATGSVDNDAYAVRLFRLNQLFIIIKNCFIGTPFCKRRSLDLLMPELRQEHGALWRTSGSF